MENIKALMGSVYHEGITVEEINSFLDGKKMVNLKDGGYVDKAKFEKLENELSTLKSEHETLKDATKDYEALKTENETFKTEKATADLKGKMSKLGINDKYFDYVKMDIDSKKLTLGDDEKANKKAVETYLTEHPEFASKAQPTDVVHKTVVVSTGSGQNTETQVKEAMNKTVNSNLREALGFGGNN